MPVLMKSCSRYGAAGRGGGQDEGPWAQGKLNRGQEASADPTSASDFRNDRKCIFTTIY